MLLIINIATFIYFNINYHNHPQSELCRLGVFTTLRVLGFTTQLIFTLIATRLYSRMIWVIQSIRESFIKDEDYYEQKRRLSQLKLLVMIMLAGASILLLVNFVYYLSEDCRIINHIGDDDKYNFSDTLNSTLKVALKLFTFFLPFIITLVIFRKKYKTAPEPEVEECEY